MTKTKTQVTSQLEEKPQGPSPIYTIHNKLINLPILIRSEICEECGWSIPSFYRKIKRGRVSNAELEKASSLIATNLERILADIQKKKIA